MRIILFFLIFFHYDQSLQEILAILKVETDMG